MQAHLQVALRLGGPMVSTSFDSVHHHQVPDPTQTRLNDTGLTVDVDSLIHCATPAL